LNRNIHSQRRNLKLGEGQPSPDPQGGDTAKRGQGIFFLPLLFVDRSFIEELLVLHPFLSFPNFGLDLFPILPTLLFHALPVHFLWRHVFGSVPVHPFRFLFFLPIQFLRRPLFRPVPLVLI